MEICYFWVEKFKSHKNSGLTFSSEHEYSFSLESFSLTRSKKPNLPNNLFGDSVTEITGILGINGAGKSNAIEAVCAALKSNDRLETRYLLIYKIGIEIFLFANFTESISSDFPVIRAEITDHLKHLNVIYFSNIFDKNYLDFGRGVIDISVNNKNNPRTQALRREFFDVDFLNELKFINSAEFESLGIEAPPKISFKILRTLRNQFRYSPRGNTNSNSFEQLYSTFKKIRSSDKLIETSLIIKLSFIMSLIHIYSDNESLSIHIENVIKTTIQDKGDSDVISEIIYRLSLIFENERVVAAWDRDFLVRDLLYHLEHMEDLLRNVEFEKDNTLKGQKTHFTIQFNKNNFETCRLISTIITPLRFSTLSWSNISSGQKAYLNLFSSISNSLRNQHTKDPLISTLICIDEGDLYLHPQWQLDFIDRLTKSLPKIANSTVQIILTTHSPLLVSDLPIQCLLVLENEEETTKVKHNIEQTFAANIYDIYKNSFGIGKQRSGNVSSRYVDQITNILDKDSVSSDEFEILNEALLTIGDKLLAFHIRKRINND